jgi:signal transduction histidine kinase
LATISEAQKQLKSIIYDLTPPEMDQGFIEALESLCRRIDSLPNLEVKLTIQEGFSNDFMESIDFINVFRIIQEFVNNSMKHAEASVIEIKVSFSIRLVKIELSDDGIGFDEEKSLKGVGLSSIYHRMLMQDIKGKLESEPGRGTTLKMSFAHQKQNVLSN